jgi:hypothetical protein
MQLLSRNPETAPREEAVRRQVEIFRERVQEILGDGNALVSNEPGSDAAKLFEEVKEMVRSLPNQIEDKIINSSFGGKMSRKRRFHPAMMEELIFHPRFGKEDNGAMSLLVLVSMFRDDFPWIYEPGMELYRALRTGSGSAISKARRQLIDILRATHHPMFWEMYSDKDDETAFMMMREVPRFIEHAVHRIDMSSRRRERVKLNEEVKPPET